MGPLLFIVYINDLVDYLQDIQVGLYGDNTALLKAELSMVIEWLARRKLMLNILRTKYMIFGKVQQLLNI